jgi:hypothetical protein
MSLMRWTLMATMLCASPVSAGPITINFAGQFALHDIGSTSPEFLSLQAALAAQGVVPLSGLGSGSPVVFSMTVNPDATADALGSYANALVSAEFTVGALSYSTGPSAISSIGGVRTQISPAFGPTLAANGLIFPPVWMQFVSGGPGFPTLGAALGDINSWSNSLAFLSFHPPGNPPPDPSQGFSQGFLATSALHVTSVSVPEPGTLLILSGALLVAGLPRARRSRFRRPRA